MEGVTNELRAGLLQLCQLNFFFIWLFNFSWRLLFYCTNLLRAALREIFSPGDAGSACRSDVFN